MPCWEFGPMCLQSSISGTAKRLRNALTKERNDFEIVYSEEL